eukprot:7868167-Ditylum_brightwellii.AAC.1
MQKAMTRDEDKRTDIYGKCTGETTGCGRDRKSEDKHCVDEVMKSYKFYLAFENTRCKDYISEKPARGIHFGM